MKAERFYLISGIISLLICLFCLMLCITAGFNWIHISFVAISLIFGILTIILKDGGYCYALIIAATILSYALPMSNILPFFLLALIMLQHPKWKFYLIFYYFIHLFIEEALIEYGILVHCTETEGPGVIHLAIHILLTLFFFVSISYFVSIRFSRRELNLTDDEKKILEELKEVKMLKNCRSFSKNTLTQKLREARERNNIETNAELLMQYQMQD